MQADGKPGGPACHVSKNQRTRTKARAACHPQSGAKSMLNAVAFAYLPDPLDRIPEMLRRAPANEALRALGRKQHRDRAPNSGRPR
jgi:hypothetical protein